MSFIVPKKNLFNAVQKTLPLVPAKNPMQILYNFKIEFSTSKMIISATDLEQSIQISTEIIGDRDVDITINAKKFFEIVRELHDDDVVLDVMNSHLLIQSGGSFSCSIAGIDSRDFPLCPEIKPEATFMVKISELIDMIDKSSFAVSKDDARACLCGILWEIYPEKTGMVATDGHRLGHCVYAGSYSIKESISSILRLKTLQNIIRVCEDEKHDSFIRITLGDKYIIFQTDTMSMYSKLIDGPYPDFKKVIPENNPKIIIIDKNILIESVRRVSILSNQKTHLVKWIFSNGKLEISITNKELGGIARQIIPVEYEGEEHILGLNAQYLLEILNKIKTAQIRFETNTQLSACIILPFYKNNEELKSEDLFLIMPLRIIEEPQEYENNT